MFIVNVVGRIGTDKSGKEAPAAEKSPSEGNDFSGASRTVKSSPSETG